MPLIMKSDRLKKLESELNDLEQWLKLGLVPKKDIEKHKVEIASIQERIAEENNRLQHLKDTGEAEEYITPKRSAQKPSGYPDTATIADIDLTEETSGLTETTYDMETETAESDSPTEEVREEEGDEALLEEEEEEDPFSDKNRWRRGILDPDADNW